MTRDPRRVRVGGPLAQHASCFAEELAKRGYSPWCAVRHLQLLAQVSRWLEGQGLAACDLDEGRVGEFLRARRAQGYAGEVSERSVVTLLGYVPALRLAPPAQKELTAVERLVEKYRRYLVEERALAAGTVRAYVGVARAFLSGREVDGALDLSQLSGKEVTAFVVGECRRRRVAWAQALVPGLRSLLRFLSFEGLTAHPLAGAVPAASAPKGFLPRGLDAGVVEALPASCDTSTAVGRRDLAVLTLLSRLGLRAAEVAGLGLDDVDWHHGELVVRGKGGRRDRLPLPADVGEALAAYLVDGRPETEDRAVFLRVHAPVTAMTPTNVSAIVRRACKRAGVPEAGAHRLRHSTATSMLRAGGSLAEVGQVLRQSRAATTAVYAKVDRIALRAMAQPWPGALA